MFSWRVVDRIFDRGCFGSINFWDFWLLFIAGQKDEPCSFRVCYFVDLNVSVVYSRRCSRQKLGVKQVSNHLLQRPLYMKIVLKRIYNQSMPSDGLRILVDRLWPRGLSKEKAAVDVWMKQIAPSTSLRQWFGHDPKKWQEFRIRYLKELQVNEADTEKLKSFLSGERTTTLLFAAKEVKLNHAVVLREFLIQKSRRDRTVQKLKACC